MHAEVPQKLHPIRGDWFFNRPVAVIFGNKSYFVRINVYYTLVCNGHPMGGCIGPGI